MAWTQADTDEALSDPEIRAQHEESMRVLTRTNPVMAARRQAILNGDETTWRRIWLQNQMFRMATRAKTNPIYQGLLDHLKRRLREFESST